MIMEGSLWGSLKIWEKGGIVLDSEDNKIIRASDPFHGTGRVVVVDRKKLTRRLICDSGVIHDLLLGSISSERLKWLEGLNPVQRLFALSASPEHVIVSNLEGERVHRQIGIDISRLQRIPGGEELLGICCTRLCHSFVKVLSDHPVFRNSGNQYLLPNMVIALGGARYMASYVTSAISESCGVGKATGGKTPYFELEKIIEKGVLIGFRFSKHDAHLEQKFPPNKAFAIIIDDAAFTLRSLQLARRFLESKGIHIMGVLVLFNQYGPVWIPESPFPINVVLGNMSFRKFSKKTCPICGKDNTGEELIMY